MKRPSKRSPHAGVRTVKLLEDFAEAVGFPTLRLRCCRPLFWLESRRRSVYAGANLASPLWRDLLVLNGRNFVFVWSGNRQK